MYYFVPARLQVDAREDSEIEMENLKQRLIYYYYYYLGILLIKI